MKVIVGLDTNTKRKFIEASNVVFSEVGGNFYSVTKGRSGGVGKLVVSQEVSSVFNTSGKVTILLLNGDCISNFSIQGSPLSRYPSGNPTAAIIKSNLIEKEVWIPSKLFNGMS